MGRKLTGKLDDNWNQGDVWLIKKNYKMSMLTNSKSASELNSMLVKAYNKKDIIQYHLNK